MAEFLVGLTPILKSWLWWGGVAQFGYGGISSTTKVSNQYAAAEDMCRRNQVFSQQKSVLETSLQNDETLSVEIPIYQKMVEQWSTEIANMQRAIKRGRTSALHSYVFFLWFLAFLTTMLFFAIEKKGGRLDRLFAKIDKISQATSVESTG